MLLKFPSAFLRFGTEFAHIGMKIFVQSSHASPIPPPSPTVIPLPHRHRGYPLEYGGTVAHENFHMENGKTQGALFKKEKIQEGVPFLEGGLPGKLERKKLRGGYPFERGFMGKF